MRISIVFYLVIMYMVSAISIIILEKKASKDSGNNYYKHISSKKHKIANWIVSINFCVGSVLIEQLNIFEKHSLLLSCLISFIVSSGFIFALLRYYKKQYKAFSSIGQ